MAAKKLQKIKMLAMFMVMLILSITMISCNSKDNTTSKSSSGGSKTSSAIEDNQSKDPTNESSKDAETNSQGSTGSVASGNAQNNSSKSSTASNTVDNNVDVKGYTFTIVSALLPTSKGSDNTLFEKLLFERIAEVEKSLGCKIKIVNTLETSPNVLAPMIQAGKKVGDIMEVELRYMPSLLGAGYLQPWNEVSGINVNNENVIASYTKLAKIGNKNWGLQFTKPPEVRYCIVVNKTLLSQNGVNAEGIYDLINKKQWNFDKFREYAIAATKVSGGTYKSYGIGGDPRFVTDMFLAANNAKLVTVDSNGKASSTYTSASVVNAMNYMNKLINEDKVFMTTSGMSTKSTFNSSKPDYTAQFIQGKIAFLLEDSWVINQKIKPKVKNFDYGMLMMPMGPNASSYTSASEHARVFTLTSTNKSELSKTVKIFNELIKPPAGYTGKDWWVDDIQLDYFQTKDTKSINIYKQSLENSVWDIGLGISSLEEGFKENVVYGPMFWNSGATPESAIQSIKGNYDKAINEIFK